MPLPAATPPEEDFDFPIPSEVVAQEEEAEAAALAEQQEAAEAKTGVMHAVKDVAWNVVEGVGEGLQSTLEFFQPGTYALAPEEKALMGYDPDQRIHVQDYEAPEDRPQTMLGGIARGTAQFFTGFVGLGSMAKGATLLMGASKAAKSGALIARGAATDAIAFDPHEEGLMNGLKELSEEHPWVKSFIIEGLAIDGDESDFVGRMKHMAEGAVGTAVVETLAVGLRGLGKWRRLRKEGKIEEAKQALIDATAKVEAAQEKALKDHERLAQQKADLEGTKQEDIDFRTEPKQEELNFGQGAPEQAASPTPAGTPAQPAQSAAAAPSASAAEPKAAPRISTEDKQKFIDETLNTPEEAWTPKTTIFNFDKMLGPDKWKKTIDDMAVTMAKDIEKKTGGVRSIDESIDRSLKLGEMTGANREQVLAWAAKDAENAFEVEARMRLYQRAILSMSHELGENAAKLDILESTGKATPAHDAQLLDNILTFADFMGDVKAAQTGMGRGMRNLQEPYGKLQRSAFPEAKAAAEGAAPAATSEVKLKAIREQRKALFDELTKGSDEGKKLAGVDTDRLGKDLVTVGRIAKTYIDEGVVHVDDFIKKFRADAPDADVTDDQLKEAFGKVAPKSEAATAVGEAGKSLRDRLMEEVAKAGGPKGVRALARRLAATGGDPTKMRRMLEPETRWMRGFNAYTEYWVNALLSGPKTQIVNITSNMLQALTMGGEQVLGGLMGRDLATAREGIGQFIGMWKSAMESVKMAGSALKTEANFLDVRNALVADTRHAITGETIETAWLRSATAHLGQIVRLPSRFLLASDEFFKQVNYRGKLYGQATREGLDQGLKGKQLSDFIEDAFQDKVKNGFTKPVLDAKGEIIHRGGQATNLEALEYARKATFTQELTGLAKKYQDAVVAHPGLRLITPFVSSPTNVIRSFGERANLLAPLSKAYKAEIAAGGARAAAARGKLATGSLLWVTGAGFAMSGSITGKGPKDRELRNALMATGWRPYSIKIGDTYYGYNRLDPLGMFLGLSADFTDVAGQLQDGEMNDIGTAMLMAIGNNVTNKTYLKGISDIFDAMQGEGNFFYNRLGSHVPTGIKQASELLGITDDTYMREVRSMADALLSRIPGWSDEVAARRNVFGEKIRFPAGWGPDSVSPISLSKDLKDTVKAEMARFESGFRMPPEKRDGAKLRDFKNKQGQDAYDRWLELRTLPNDSGQNLKEALTELVESDEYQALDPTIVKGLESERERLVKNVVGQFQNDTWNTLLEEFPDLQEAVDLHGEKKSLMRDGSPDAIQQVLSLPK